MSVGGVRGMQQVHGATLEIASCHKPSHGSFGVNNNNKPAKWEDSKAEGEESNGSVSSLGASEIHFLPRNGPELHRLTLSALHASPESVTGRENLT